MGSSSGVVILTESEIKEALAELSGWSHENDRLVKEFVLSDFRAAVALIVQIGFEAEARNHHPELNNVYNRLHVSLCTHDAGNVVTGKDVELAFAIQSIVDGSN